jgi:ABC-type transport system involved in multi-copper enzyme maturation permease subunit
VSGALVMATIRQLFSQPVRTGALIGCAILPLLQLGVDPDPRLGTPQWAIFIAVIAAAGVIGLEASTGSLALIFTRPITRFGYVGSRWAGAALVAVTLVLVSFGGEIALLVARDADVTLTPILITLADRLSLVIGIVSVMTCFSAMVSSLGDLVIWLSLHIVAMSLAASGEVASIPFLSNVAVVLRRVANPAIDSFRLISSMRTPWSELALYVATVLLALGVAGFVLNRKELSYASE